MGKTSASNVGPKMAANVGPTLAANVGPTLAANAWPIHCRYIDTIIGVKRWAKIRCRRFGNISDGEDITTFDQRCLLADVKGRTSAYDLCQRWPNLELLSGCLAS